MDRAIQVSHSWPMARVLRLGRARAKTGANYGATGQPTWPGSTWTSPAMTGDSARICFSYADLTESKSSIIIEGACHAPIAHATRRNSRRGIFEAPRPVRERPCAGHRRAWEPDQRHH